MVDKKETRRIQRFLQAIILHKYWRFRWYHAVLIWLVLAIYGWGGSPYFMMKVIGPPEPGTAPRYMGTVRVDGELQRTQTGWRPPKYFIETDKGEVEFHCGYLPYRRECGPFPGPFDEKKASEVYTIGYDPYWGVDQIKYPLRLSHLDEYSLPALVSDRRVLYLTRHIRDFQLFLTMLCGYCVLVYLAYRASHPK